MDCRSRMNQVSFDVIRKNRITRTSRAGVLLCTNIKYSSESSNVVASLREFHFVN